MTDEEKRSLEQSLQSEEYFQWAKRWYKFLNYLRFLAGIIVGVIIMYIAQLV